MRCGCDEGHVDTYTLYHRCWSHQVGQLHRASCWVSPSSLCPILPHGGVAPVLDGELLWLFSLLLSKAFPSRRSTSRYCGEDGCLRAFAAEILQRVWPHGQMACVPSWPPLVIGWGDALAVHHDRAGGCSLLADVEAQAVQVVALKAWEVYHQRHLMCHRSA